MNSEIIGLNSQKGSSPSGIVVIEEYAIQAFVNHFIQNKFLIESKGQNVLKSLHKEVFSSDMYDFDKNGGYFKLEDLTLLEVRKDVFRVGAHQDINKTNYYFKYDVYFSLESDNNILLDPYHFYFATFSNFNILTLLGVRRDE